MSNWKKEPYPVKRKYLGDGASEWDIIDGIWIQLLPGVGIKNWRLIDRESTVAQTVTTFKSLENLLEKLNKRFIFATVELLDVAEASIDAFGYTAENVEIDVDSPGRPTLRLLKRKQMDNGVSRWSINPDVFISLVPGTLTEPGSQEWIVKDGEEQIVCGNNSSALYELQSRYPSLDLELSGVSKAQREAELWRKLEEAKRRKDLDMPGETQPPKPKRSKPKKTKTLVNTDRYTEVGRFPSATKPDKYYTVKMDANTGDYTCNCPSWTFNQRTDRTCKHTDKLVGNKRDQEIAAENAAKKEIVLMKKTLTRLQNQAARDMIDEAIPYDDTPTPTPASSTQTRTSKRRIKFD